ncbi:glycosyltransferase family 4 protein [Egicoccus halophilus]|uniref:Glycogen synthase n=1 Tax=Egicoccus halophilus TaxID=1670830 RepID=A0A8J3EYI0_9ACTN|nr:glycosyltransferase family 4 protein [Egicoccus halophilus]GGI07936.1 glycogen synthase [Egicoccus halophilus]
MRVLMLTWEYPPHVVGGLGRHCAALARNLVAQGHDVHVVTRGPSSHAAAAGGEVGDVPLEEWREGVHVVRVPEAPPVIPFEDLVPWVLAFNNRVQAAAAGLARRYDVDVVHAHDWLVAYAAAGIKEAFGLPLVATVHATEYGRHQGWLPGPMNKLIHQVEWWLTYEARRVITCSTYMREQVEDIFALPDDKVDVVPNGVAVRDFALPADEVADFRRTLVGPRTRMVLFAGRLEYEKGVQTVLEALQEVRAAVGPVKFFIAGIGTYSATLRRRVRELGLRRHVHFTGFLADHELRLHYAAADVAVAPSIYEPFGLVAVEAMACGTPVVAGDTGGLREIVAGGSGLSFPPQDAGELAGALTRVLADRELAQGMVARAHARIRDRYDWASVAAATVGVYHRAVAEEAELAGGEQRPALRPILRAAPILALDEAAG